MKKTLTRLKRKNQHFNEVQDPLTLSVAKICLQDQPAPILKEIPGQPQAAQTLLLEIVITTRTQMAPTTTRTTMAPHITTMDLEVRPTLLRVVIKHTIKFTFCNDESVSSTNTFRRGSKA